MSSSARVTFDGIINSEFSKPGRDTIEVVNHTITFYLAWDNRCSIETVAVPTNVESNFSKT